MAQQGPDPAWVQYQQQMDDQNMRTLTILHRIYGGLIALGSCCGLAYLLFVFGLIGFAAVDSREPGAAVAGGVVGVIWLILFALVGGHALLNVLAANWIRDRRNWVGIVIVSVINCLNMPLGLGLAVYTLIVINRPWIKSTFRS